MAIRFFDYRILHVDIVIFLDIPIYKCLYRVYKRAIMNFGNVYFSSAVGCPERGIDLKFLKFIIGFNKKGKSVIKKILQQYSESKKIFIVKNKYELDTVIKKIKEDYYMGKL